MLHARLPRKTWKQPLVLVRICARKISEFKSQSQDLGPLSSKATSPTLRRTPHMEVEWKQLFVNASMECEHYTVINQPASTRTSPVNINPDHHHSRISHHQPLINERNPPYGELKPVWLLFCCCAVLFNSLVMASHAQLVCQGAPQRAPEGHGHLNVRHGSGQHQNGHHEAQGSLGRRRQIKSTFVKLQPVQPS